MKLIKVLFILMAIHLTVSIKVVAADYYESTQKTLNTKLQAKGFLGKTTTEDVIKPTKPTKKKPIRTQIIDYTKLPITGDIANYPLVCTGMILIGVGTILFRGKNIII